MLSRSLHILYQVCENNVKGLLEKDKMTKGNGQVLLNITLDADTGHYVQYVSRLVIFK